MRAVILVGGQGTRLRPLTLTTPKQMLPVADRPMIEHVVSHLAEHGVVEVILALGYRPDAFLQVYPDGLCRGVKLSYSVEDAPLDTAGAIRLAASEAHIDDTFVVVNGDVLTNLDVKSLVAFHRSHQGLATIALTPVPDPSSFGVVPTDADGRVLAFIEKPPAGTAPTNLINAGTYVMEPEILELIPGDRRVSIERETFPLLASRGQVFAMASDAAWVDSGTPHKLLEANLVWASRLWGSARAHVHPSVMIDPSAMVSNAVVGPGVVIGAGVSVQHSVILSGARIDEGARIDGSIVGRQVHVGAGAVIENLSVIGDGMSIEPGTTLSGARYPEEPE